MSQPRIVIAIDGPAASGKSSTAKQVARQMDYLYIDTGAMYRAVTLLALQNNVDLHDTDLLMDIAGRAEIEFVSTDDGMHLLLNGVDVSEEIRTTQVTNSIKPIAANPAVREILVEKQRLLGANGGVVMDGRDIATVVFPDAELKIYMEASAEARAKRRLRELLNKEHNATYEAILRELIARDESDMNRAAGPLKRDADAVLIDTTELTLSQQVAKIVSLARGVIRKLSKTN
ncbi:MAG: (d)CMP kinase [Calditrichia bacterium]